MLRIVGDRPIRVTYDQGTMEVFMPSFGHDSDAYLLGRMVDMLTEELDIDVEGGDTTTHKRQDLDKGAEPDKCYWLRENARRIRGKRQLDLNADPVPDLIIEVDVTRTSLDRLKIFAAMGVPEVWRSDRPNPPVPPSSSRRDLSAKNNQPELPTLPVSSVARFLKEGRTADKTAWIRSFRAFVREQVLPRPDCTAVDRIACSRIVAQHMACRLTIGRLVSRRVGLAVRAGRGRGPAEAGGRGRGRRRARRWPARAASRRACGRRRRSGFRSRGPGRCRACCRRFRAAGRPRSPRLRPGSGPGRAAGPRRAGSRVACEVGSVSKPASSSVAPTRTRPSSRGTR